MHNHDIVFDNDNNKIGFIQAHCSAKKYIQDENHENMNNIT